MRPTSVLGLAGLVVIGIILADLIANPTGTKQAASGLASIEKISVNGLLGKTS
jgi:hypothetical protein